MSGFYIAEGGAEFRFLAVFTSITLWLNPRLHLILIIFLWERSFDFCWLPSFIQSLVCGVLTVRLARPPAGRAGLLRGLVVLVRHCLVVPSFVGSLLHPLETSLVVLLVP